ncbi:tRNA (adenosine(37)-N6)-dimethylallyltransferase MiaA [Thioalkalivibrio sp. XN279]|uniref:tRNA (adenosine(37)-N6)-dimethylallyltransferase MiaA n=1 Tax=Thioalkalivibrio sp. XN279 TaxID=2714953 RepID=UPI001407A844|nr:tRNA (adenosine(37)-N6)-dimethylallyltransferase MiaA [Thioalkalivibrio sp. XN279]NHA14777.1 tRNA (adenosine(37)-N6)-dimethylallyltransferase MiaA [Thioalkalivibrio sp. XN279]
MGPTASGKTGLALELARALPVEIVSVDSALVYRGMDIGTAKPAAALRAEIPHHLVDLLDPAEAYSAGRFRRDALEAMRDIRARGRVPLLVGGTMLYFRALQRGLAELPQADPVVRAELDRDAAARGWPALHAELHRVDPMAAARIQPADAQRIQRALEVWRLTGRPLSELQAAGDCPLEGWRLLKLGLAPTSRTALHEAIAARFAAMMAAGFLQEVEQLHARGDLHPGLPSIRAVGYRQLWAAVAGESEVDDAVAAAVTATRRLAKRQMTWLRAETGLHWLQGPAEALGLAAGWVSPGSGESAPV